MVLAGVGEPMSATGAWSVLVVLLVICGGVVYLLLRSDREYERADEAPTQVLWTVAWTHEAPDYPMTVAVAHRERQWHRACDREDCPRKAIAWQVLVEAGHIEPDASRPTRDYSDRWNNTR